jgi:hypothetical protein
MLPWTAGCAVYRKSSLKAARALSQLAAAMQPKAKNAARLIAHIFKMV